MTKEGRLAAFATAVVLAAAVPGAAFSEPGGGTTAGQRTGEGPVATVVVPDGTKKITTIPCFPNLAQRGAIFCPGGVNIASVSSIPGGAPAGENDFLAITIGKDTNYLNKESNVQAIGMQASPSSELEISGIEPGQRVSASLRRTGPDGVAVFSGPLPPTAFDQKRPMRNLSGIAGGWEGTVNNARGVVIVIPGSQSLKVIDETGSVPVETTIPDRLIARKGFLVDLKGGDGSYLLGNIGPGGNVEQLVTSDANNRY